ncbi:MAG: SWIM zinc finger family protein [Methanoregula sp.]|nr:SWIM zinc finger family protein [Methanoregula sp.]
MSDLWQLLKEKKVLDVPLRLAIEETFGNRGKKALAALDAGRVKKFLDFFVVQGRTAEYIVEDDFCTCSDFMYRGRTCWHLLAVRIAKETDTFQQIDSWYQDKWKK